MLKKTLIASTILGVYATASLAGDVMISKSVKSIDMELNDEKFTIMRNQTAGNKISTFYKF